MAIVKGFTVKNWRDLRPVEDKYSISSDSNILAVADGITRDPRGMLVLPSMKNPLGMASFFLRYPRPSPAARASEIFCDAFNTRLSVFKDKNKDILSKEERKFVKELNNKIKKRISKFNKKDKEMAFEIMNKLRFWLIEKELAKIAGHKP